MGLQALFLCTITIIIIIVIVIASVAITAWDPLWFVVAD